MKKRRAQVIDRTGATAVAITTGWSQPFRLDALDVLIVNASVDAEVQLSIDDGATGQYFWEESGDPMQAVAGIDTGYDNSELSSFSYFRIRAKAGSGTVNIHAVCKG